MLNKTIGAGQSIEFRFDMNPELCEKISSNFGVTVIPVSGPKVPHPINDGSMIEMRAIIFGECQESSLLDLDLHGIDMVEEIFMIMFQEQIHGGNIKVGSIMYAWMFMSDTAYFNNEGELVRRFKLRALFEEPALAE